MKYRYSLRSGLKVEASPVRKIVKGFNKPIAVIVILVVFVSLGLYVPFGKNKASLTAYSVPGQNYEICNDAAEYLTSPWTYDGLSSGSQSYTVAQYEALSGYGTTLPPLPAYISSEGSSATAAEIFAPGSDVNVPPYNLPGTPIIYFFEGGAYSQLGFDSLSGDEFIGGSENGYPEPEFDDGGNAGGIDQQNGTYAFSGGQSTLASGLSSGATTVTTTSPIPGYLQYVTFSDGSTYQLSNVSGDTLTLASPLTTSETVNSTVWGSRAQPIAEISSSAAQGAASATLTSSSLPLMQYADVVINSEDYVLNSVSGSQSGYTVGFRNGGADMAMAANTPVYYGSEAGAVTIQYLNIDDDQHTTTGTITTGSGWIITNNNIHDGNSGGPGYGVALYGGDNSTIEYNCISKMGDYAANVFGSNSKFDYNEVYETNYQKDPGCGCSGGGKWWGTLNADIVDNAFINDGIADDGFAIWLDNGNAGTQIAGNYFDMTGGPSISEETGFNLDVSNNLFEDDNWGSGTGCGNTNCVGDVGLNSSGGFYVPGSRYENEMLIQNNQFINDWGGVGVWQSGARSCENSGESWPDDASYCSGGFPNTSEPASAGAYYFSHDGDDNHGGTSSVMQTANAGSTKILVQGQAEAISDQIGFADPVSTTTTTTSNVSTFSGSGTISATTTGFPTSGELRVGTSNAWSDAGGSYTGAILSYTGTTAGSFTGVSLVRGSGTLAGPIQQVQQYKVTADTCYANDCAVTVTPALAATESVGTEVTNAGTCQLFATSSATPTSPVAPDGISYWDGCQWETRGIAVSGNTFVFQPSVIAKTAPLTGGGTTTSCTATNTDGCGTNFMAYQDGGELPFGDNTGANAMMSGTSFTGCPNWDTGCTTDPLANLNALANPPGANAGNGEAPENDVWSDNTYYGPWGWSTYEYGNCDVLPTDSTTGKTAPESDCNGTINYAVWQGAWQQDQGSTYNNTSYPTPSTPSNVNATANSPTSVTVTWNASTDTGGPGIGGYIIYRNGTQIGTTNGATTSYTDTSATPDTLYSYTVQAYDADLNLSDQSAAADVFTTTSSNPNPTPPTNVGAVANSSSSVTVSWTASTDSGGPGIGGYDIFRNGTQIGTTNAAAASYTDTTVSASTSYSYTVVGFDKATPADVSTQSSPAAAVTTPANSNPNPSTPTNVKAAANSATSVTVTWSVSTDSGGPGIGGYDIFRNGSQIGSTNAGTTTITDTTVSADTQYSYTIQAFDTANDTSSQSAAATVTTPSITYPLPSTPTNVDTNANSPTSVTVSWTASTDTDGPGLGGYYVFRNGTKITSTNPGITSYTDNSVSANTAYVYTVEAFDTATPIDVSSRSAASDITTPTSCLLPLYRLHNPQDGDHLYTTNMTEVYTATSSVGYVLEGIVGYVSNYDASGDTALYRFLQKSNGIHFYTTSSAEETALAANAAFSYEGITGYVSSSSGSGLTEFYRLYNSHTGLHFYTSSSAEETSLTTSGGYVLEGNAGYVSTAATASCHSSFYRLANSSTNDHLYTTSITEVIAASSGGYKLEGVVGYIDLSSQTGDTALYRLRQNSTGYHFYTISSAEESSLASAGYTSEGTAGYVSSSSGTNLAALLRLYNSKTGQHFYTASTAEAAGLTTTAGGYQSEGNVGYVWNTE